MRRSVITTIVLACAAPLAAGQVLSHLTFEGETPGSQLTTIDESGLFWTAYANDTAWLPVGSDLSPPAALRSDDAAPSLVSADFSPGLGSLEIYGDELTLPDSGWTIECFVRFNDVGGFQTIFGRDKDVVETRTLVADFYFQKDDTNRFRVAYTAGYEDTNGDGTEEIIRPIVRTEERAMIAGKWYHLAAVYDGATQVLKLYVDGILEGEGAVDGNVIPVIDPSVQFWSVGRGSYQNELRDSLNGQLDDFRITAAALEPDEFLGKAPEVVVEPTCPADFNDDGARTVQDLLAFLSAFRAGC